MGTQRRRLDDDHAQAEVQVLPEAAARDIVGQVAVGGRHQADVARARRPAAHRRELAGFQGTQEPRLHAERHLGHFIEEQRAVVGAAKDAFVVGHRAGERAARVAEQFALEHAFAHGAAVEADERSGGAARIVVDGARHQFLAGAALAEDQDIDVERRGVGHE